MSLEPTADDLALGKIVWNYLRVESPLCETDGILCLGSSDLSVADWAARYFLDGWGPWILFSGNVGRLTDGIFEKPEAETFAARARALGVPDDKIFLEPRSTNTGENVRFSRELVERKGLTPKKLLVVQKPYMGRRALATMRQFWPEVEAVTRSSDLGFEEYLAAWSEPGEVLHLMAGDLQRMKLYPPLGFQAPVEMPREVWDAFEALVTRGYTGHLVRGS